MKVFFLLILLSNIVFFLWEFNSKQVNNTINRNSHDTKQILLLSELTKDKIESSDILEGSNDAGAHQNTNKINVENGSGRILISSDIKNLSDSDNVTLIEPETATLIDPEIIITDAEQVADSTEVSNNIDTVIQSPVDEKKNQIESRDASNSEALDDEVESKPVVKKPALLIQDDNKENVNVELPKKSYCYQVQPFLDEVQLIDWIHSNNLDENTVTRNKKEVKTVNSYLVYYPQAETYEQSKKDTEMLRSKGFTDFWLFRKGELKGLISLGLFAKEYRAKVMQKKYVDSGLNVDIMPRYKTESVWYAKFMSESINMNESVTASEKLTIQACENN